MSPFGRPPLPPKCVTYFVNGPQQLWYLNRYFTHRQSHSLPPKAASKYLEKTVHALLRQASYLSDGVSVPCFQAS